MGVMALALDISLAMTDRRNAQNAADHAALVAAYTKCTSGNPVARANTSVTRNGYTPAELTLTNVSGNKYEAIINSNNPTFFGRVLGFSALNVTTRALADCAAGSGGGNAIFAMGDTCSSFSKEQLDISGSNQTSTAESTATTTPTSAGRTTTSVTATPVWIPSPTSRR